MAKKIFLIPLLTFMIIFGSQSEVNAKDVYVFSANGFDYYIVKTRSIDYAGYYYVWLLGINKQGGQNMIEYIYFPKNGEKYYQLIFRNSAIEEKAVAVSSQAQLVYNKAKERNEDS